MPEVARRVAILQSNYIPWKGYFDLMNSVDEFILFDDVQYTRRDWRNRNRIVGASGPQWLTIPVQVKGKYLQAIKDTKVADESWRARHWETLRGCYSRAPHFRDYIDVIEPLYRDGTETFLSEVNRRFLETIAGALGITTQLTSSMDYDIIDGKTERLLSLCRQAGATDYLSGPAARDYLDEEMFRAAGISVSWMSYDGYPEYDQRRVPFEHGVSVLDLLFNVGVDAPSYMLSFAS
jgi:hypothetical protein